MFGKFSLSVSDRISGIVPVTGFSEGKLPNNETMIDATICSKLCKMKLLLFVFLLGGELLLVDKSSVSIGSSLKSGEIQRVKNHQLYSMKVRKA